MINMWRVLRKHLSGTRRCREFSTLGWHESDTVVLTTRPSILEDEE